MHFVFVYGTLKHGEPNHYLLENDANGVRIFRGKAKTINKFPLVVASRYNIPFVLDCAGTGLNIQGEIYEYVKVFDIDASIWREGGQMVSGRWRRRYEAVINSTPHLFWTLFTPLTLFLSTTHPPLVMVTSGTRRAHVT